MKKGTVKDIWNANAEFWDKRMGEGNDFHKTLLEPTQLKMLDIKPGQKILDIACGNGQFAREMGAKVTATDFSEKFIEIARAKSSKNIKYEVIDATKPSDLQKLVGTKYDAVACTMAFMDIENIQTFIKFLPKLLKKNGSFVFSIPHPYYNSGEYVLMRERDDAGGEVNNRYYVKIRNYLVEKSYLGVGMSGQPKPQYYFHRPLSTILSYFFQNGFVLDAYEEPSFKNINNPVGFSDNVYQNIPAALVCRLRLLE